MERIGDTVAMLTLKIDLDNDSYRNLDGSLDVPEVAETLSHLSVRIKKVSEDNLRSLTIHDYNGNNVGTMVITGKIQNIKP